MGHSEDEAVYKIKGKRFDRITENFGRYLIQYPLLYLKIDVTLVQCPFDSHDLASIVF